MVYPADDNEVAAEMPAHRMIGFAFSITSGPGHSPAYWTDGSMDGGLQS